ncbi:MAG: hypothetical protein ACI9VS_003931 [Candidatus Binatia bacterium]|jgi:hypothetical protein
MARTRKLNLFASCCLLASAWALYLTNSHPSAANSTRFQSGNLHASSLQVEDATTPGEHENLTTKVEELSKSLDEAATKLEAALNRLETSQNPPQRARFSAAEIARQMAEVAPPRESVHRDRNGRVERVFSFDELTAVDGKSLANAVTFKEAYGRRLVFRSIDNKPLAFDAEEVHPGVLAHLGIQLSEVLAADRRDQERRRLRAEAATRRRLARIQEAAKFAAASKAEEQPSAPIAQPAGQSTYITIQQPSAPAANNYYPNHLYSGYSGYSSYSYPVHYGYQPRYPLWRHGFQTPTVNTGAWSQSPTTRQLPQVQAAMNSGFRFNNTFRFNK